MTSPRLFEPDSPARQQPVLEVEDLSVDFRIDEGWTRVVDHVSLELEEGRTVGLVGESGSGKTVTSLAIMGLISPPRGRISSGRVHLAGRDLLATPERLLRRLRGKEIAMIFQEPRRSLDPAFTVGEQIAEGIRLHLALPRREAWRRAVEMLDVVEIPDARRRAREYPHTFSGGMCQRVMLAAALACNPRVLVADEPTTALDVTVQSQMLDLLRDLQARMGLAILFVTHDLAVVAEMADDVAIMYAGQIVERGPASTLFFKPRHPYTEGLLDSLAVADPKEGELKAIPGAAATPGKWPNGCRFHPRCPYRTNECETGDVPFHEVGDAAASRCLRFAELDLRGVR